MNLSMPGLRNQLIYGEVFAAGRSQVWIDAGHSQLAVLRRSVRPTTAASQPPSSLVGLHLLSPTSAVSTRFLNT